MYSGDKAYELFMANEPFPLHDFLDQWRDGGTQETGYVLAVIGAYQHMVANCGDGRYNGKIRKG